MRLLIIASVLALCWFFSSVHSFTSLKHVIMSQRKAIKNSTACTEACSDDDKEKMYCQEVENCDCEGSCKINEITCAYELCVSRTIRSLNADSTARTAKKFYLDCMKTCPEERTQLKWYNPRVNKNPPTEAPTEAPAANKTFF